MKSVNINEKIAAHRVILISSGNENKGEFIKSAAISLAKQEGLDLVEVGLQNGVPVCKIMDYGKELYNKQKQDRHQKHAPSPKTVRFHYNTDSHDIETKRKQINDFLAKGHKVTLNMEIKGREKYVGGTAAKEKFFQLVSSFSSTATLADIVIHAKGFNYTLNPGTK